MKKMKINLDKLKFIIENNTVSVVNPDNENNRISIIEFGADIESASVNFTSQQEISMVIDTDIFGYVVNCIIDDCLLYVYIDSSLSSKIRIYSNGDLEKLKL